MMIQKISFSVISFILWCLLVGTVIYLNPQNTLNIVLFFTLCTTALAMTLFSLGVSFVIAMISVVATVLFLLMRYFGIGNFLNLVLLLGVAITLGIALRPDGRKRP